jgi:hypothetical protein
MDNIEIKKHSVSGWKPLEKVGFIPDPMILRAGEVFLNGPAGARALDRNEIEVQNALEANVGGLVEFFDMIVTRKTIPLINYGYTFPPHEAFTSIEQMLGKQVCNVTIVEEAYKEIKRGALINLARLNWDLVLPTLQHDLSELHAFLYNWEPDLCEPALDTTHQAETNKLAALEGDPNRAMLAKFLLGGLIFSGFAQASSTVHRIQPKRSRFYLGLTAAPEKVKRLTKDEEDMIFAAAVDSINKTENSDATVRRVMTLPPVLPYLLEAEPKPKNVQQLLEQALEFPNTSAGKDYLALVEAVRKDGVEARRVEDISARERKKALKLLSPYSNLDSEKSQSLEIGVEMKWGAIPTPVATYKPTIPVWLRIWWNDAADFGWLRQNLRRMWMASESYKKLSSRLVEVWKNSEVPPPR